MQNSRAMTFFNGEDLYKATYQQCVIKQIIIYSKYFPDSDWLKAHA